MKKPLNKDLVERISKVLKYDPITGLFFWKEKQSCRAEDGWFTGSVHGSYVGFRVFWERYYSHRLAWAIVHGELSSDVEIDHINGNKKDNRLANLRIASASQNQHNKTAYRNNKSGVKGVNLDGKSGKWRAKFNCNGKRYELGLFASLDEAERVVVAARAKAHGEFANHGAV
ncbi:HNH endonuclease [Pantoea piersonii]|jgi:hypothetical protein|uniref:HNH endonuclease n=1 Tax=Pantoea piersonii TaxID=2364647 RepID=UPI000EA26E88|nr:HNH endonuclease [Pantoea piersonii]MBZ6385131.1 HNH endonuclease [Pantoea piersonii]MBZ6385207.1 HNH endonuclease [Pantoea piersonii]MBZ6398659.1 HNH endonuclease [Pantoea piersonii]MBZ6398735.1 HNH endonuclease [Pantoea piersonii]MBZ6406589.1 HNH endonuclease [Pantoea piersonii]